MLNRMRSVARMLGARQWWAVGGLLLVLVLLWTAATRWDWPLAIPLAGTVALLLAALVMLVVERVRTTRSAADLERSIRGQAEDDIFGVRPERREQIEQIEREFTAALEALKHSKIGKSQGGRAALYALPWYVVIGPPAAGKTTAITESGLDFPLGANRVAGVGGTRNCEWFFSTTAILLDTAGRYVTVEEDRDEWYKFLDLLRRCRRRTPVNGVIVMASIDELLAMTPDELETAALDLRQRAGELVERLGVRFPVYLVFTKCDLLRGFVEFFGEYDRAGRDEVWGHTFGGGEQPAGGAARDQFAREFDGLAHALVRERLARLASRPYDADGAREVYLFPLEFAALRERLGEFVGRVFQPNPYQDAPEFRGFYFTSAVQEGPATDRVLRSLADGFELSTWGADHRPAAAESKSYFLRSLFTDVIVRDRNRVTPTSRATTARQRARRVVAAASVLAFVGFAWSVGSAFRGSTSDIAVVERAVRGTGVGEPRALDALGGAIATLERSQAEPRRLRRFGLDRGAEMLPALRHLYVRRALPYLEPRLFQPMEERLRAFRADSVDAGARQLAYADLRAYLLLGDSVTRLRRDSTDDAFLQGYLRGLPGQQPGDTAYTDRFVNVLRERVVATDPTLVERTRRVLYAPPTLDGLYLGLRAEGNRRAPALTMEQLLKGTPTLPFTSTAPVPAVFTKDGWEHFAEAAIEQHSRDPGRSDWVIGARPERLPAELRDPDLVADALVQRYFAEYASAWRDFLAGVRYTPATAQAVAERLQLLGDQAHSPLAALVDSVIAQTRFENRVVSDSKGLVKRALDKLKQLAGRPGTPAGAGAPGNPVDRAFMPLRDLREQDGGVALAQTLQRYQAFEQLMQSLADGSPETVAQIRTAATTARIDIGRDTRLVDPAVRQALFEQPLDLALSTVVTSSVGNLGQSLGRAWSEQVCAPFRETLASRYPFRRGGPDAALSDVERFFQPGTGIIWAFYNRSLSSLVGARDFTPVRADPGSFALSRAGRGALLGAREISDNFFGAAGVRTDFQLEPKPATVDAAPGHAVYVDRCLTIDGRRTCYAAGMPFPESFTWPGAGNTPGAELSVHVRDGSADTTIVRRAAGEWGWFHLLDLATVTPVSATSYDVTWAFAVPGRYDIRVGYRVATKSTRNPFGALRAPADFGCPATLAP